MESHLPLSPPNITTSLSSPRALSGARSALTNHRLVSHSSNNCPITQKLINPQKDQWLVQSPRLGPRRSIYGRSVCRRDELLLDIDLDGSRLAPEKVTGYQAHHTKPGDASHFPQRATHPLLNTGHRVWRCTGRGTGPRVMCAGGSPGTA